MEFFATRQSRHIVTAPAWEIREGDVLDRLREGFRFLGIDQDPDYVEIARRRIIGDSPLFNAGTERSTMAGKALGSDSRSSV